MFHLWLKKSDQKYEKPQSIVDFFEKTCLNDVSLSGCEAFGGIAQLVERLNGIQEVRGSTPLTSTKFKVTLSRV